MIILNTKWKVCSDNINKIVKRGQKVNSLLPNLNPCSMAHVEISPKVDYAIVKPILHECKIFGFQRNWYSRNRYLIDTLSDSDEFSVNRIDFFKENKFSKWNLKCTFFLFHKSFIYLDISKATCICMYEKSSLLWKYFCLLFSYSLPFYL